MWDQQLISEKIIIKEQVYRREQALSVFLNKENV